MDHFIDIYKKKGKAEYCEKLLDLTGIKINLKVDGKPFQVLYNKDTDEIEWHGRSGNETTVGPLIDDYTRLFSKPVNDAIAHIETKKDIVKEYKFLTFEVIDNNLLLTAVIDLKDNFINDAAEIRKIADKLGTEVMPTLWEGKLTQEQKDSILQIISTAVVPEKQDFIDWVQRMFSTYKAYPKKLISASDEFIEGIVFFFETEGKIVEYKLVDPTYRQSMKDRDAKHEEERKKRAEYYENCYKLMVKGLEKTANKLSSNHVESLQQNFVQLWTSPVIDELLKNAKELEENTNERYTVQVDRLIPTLQEMWKDKSKDTVAIKNLFELYMKTFYKEKKRAFIISPEFQQEINKIVHKISGVNESRLSLKDYINENMGPYEVYIDGRKDEHFSKIKWKRTPKVGKGWYAGGTVFHIIKVEDNKIYATSKE